jgi:PTH1 family peptidyl-tRNA hydrolase
MFLVLGLGNPGRKYASTRHNVGFLAIERLAERWSAPADKKHLGALVGKALIASQSATLAMPQSFMNLSGQPAASLKGYFKVQNETIVVIHDDLDIPFGDVRVKVGGGHGGHNGLRDLNKCIGADYTRIRVGVSRPPEGWDTADYVLGKWSTDEANRLADVVDDAADAAEAVLRDGVMAAMNHFNTRGRTQQSAGGSA